MESSAITLIMCLSESWLDYTEVHQGKYIDVCGVDPEHWKEYLEDKNINLNTLVGGQAVYLYYLEQQGSKRKALLKYKGVENSVKVKRIVDKILKLESEYKERIRALLKEIKENDRNENNR